MITQTIKLNLIPGGILPRIKASQYDAGSRTLRFKLYNGVQEFTIPTDSTVSIRGTKSDHTGFQYECEYSGSEVTAQITDQMTVSPGEVLAELVITKGNDRISTGNFVFENEEAALKEDAIISETDIPALERIDELVNAVNTAREDAEASATAAANSATAAAGSASNASASETNAATSATAASGYATDAAGSATSAATSAADAIGSASAASTSATNAAASETNAGNSATAAAGSAAVASGYATDAATSETNARLWAVGQTGSGSATPSDTNNAYYWAQVAASAASGGLKIEVVNELPSSGIKTDTIYLVPSSNPEEKNIKDEYLNTNGTASGWELIGSTKIDLSGYYTKTQVDAIIQSVKEYADTKIELAKLTVDDYSIKKSQSGVISVNQYDFDTVEEMEAAIENDEIPEGATIYIPGGSGGGGGADVGLSIVNGAVCITYETTTNGTGGA